MVAKRLARSGDVQDAQTFATIHTSFRKPRSEANPALPVPIRVATPVPGVFRASVPDWPIRTPDTGVATVLKQESINDR